MSKTWQRCGRWNWPRWKWRCFCGMDKTSLLEIIRNSQLQISFCSGYEHLSVQLWLISHLPFYSSPDTCHKQQWEPCCWFKWQKVLNLSLWIIPGIFSMLKLLPLPGLLLCGSRDENLALLSCTCILYWYSNGACNWIWELGWIIWFCACM